MRFSPAFLVVNIKVTTLNLENSLSQSKAFFRIEADYRKRLCIKWLAYVLILVMDDLSLVGVFISFAGV